MQVAALEIEKLKEVFHQNKKQILSDYIDFLKFPSISSEPSHRLDLLNCANWVIDYLKKIGFVVEIWETSGHPTIFATYQKVQDSQPTLLIYNHYDVQPVDPLDLWELASF